MLQDIPVFPVPELWLPPARPGVPVPAGPQPAFFPLIFPGDLFMSPEEKAKAENPPT